MDVLGNIPRCLFLGARRSRKRIFLSALIIITLWHLYLINSGNFIYDRLQVLREGIVGKPAAELDTSLRSLRLRGRSLADKALNRQEERVIIIRGDENDHKNRNRRNEFARLHTALKSEQDVGRYVSKEKSSSEFINSQRNMNSTESRQSGICMDFYLTDTNKNSYATCKPHRPTLDACKFADSLYRYDPSLSECKTNKESVEICSFVTETFHKRTLLKAKCNRRVCERLVSKIERKFMTFGVYSIDPEDGVLKSVGNFTTISELETQLPRIALLSARNKFNFVFVKCFIVARKKSLASQLVPVPPRVTTQEARKPRPKNTVNVNIVLLDSVSRSHFYRSLPKTVKTLRSLAGRSDVAPARVYDFELFQAVHGHTTHNEHAMFTGKLLPPIDPNEDAPSVRADVLFGHFKRAGYQTMWQEDLCWKEGWGLATDLVAEDWEELQVKLNESFIDNTGLTHSSCEVLAPFGTDAPFSGPKGDQICFNGKLQHSYFLQYSIDTLNTIASSKTSRPLLSYTALNVGHDDTGLRIQSLDSDLARYVSTVANDENTLTIILADHGNTYTEYTYAILEGRFEMFHPSLFVIVPNKVADLLGREALSALEVNQRRLITMIDLHHSLLPLAGPLAGFVNPVGLFTPISANRTCNDVELRTPNLCVCEGWDSPTTNDSLKISMVEFAVGKLNNMVQEQFAKSANGKTKMYPILRACQRLRPLRFVNVRERNSKSDGALITSFDIYFQAGNVVNHAEDVFHVEVKSKELANQNSLLMELVHYDRLTLFGKYDTCADEGVQLKLCICSRASKNKKTSITKLEKVPWLEYTTFLFKIAKARNIGDSECLFLIKRNHSLGQSVAFEIANTCPDEMFALKISADFDNMRLSRTLPFEINVQAGSITFAFSALAEIDYWDTFIDVTVAIDNRKTLLLV
ncbi:uncharacterized protein LOC144663392 [Oculina patagonica]